MNSIFLRIALILTAAATLAEASTILDSVSDPSATPQLYRDEANLYPMVGKVAGSGLSGSGVLISDRWVLTAGHVSLSKTSGTFTVGGTNYTIQSSITHPNFSFSGPAYDLGLLYLSTPVTGLAAATMLHLDSPTSILGKEATWVGNGLTGTGLTGAQSPFEFRAFTNVIDVFGVTYGLSSTSFVADFDKPDGSTNADESSPTATRLEGNLTSGDSGGGVFITVDGQRYLVGINSYTGRFGPGLESSYGSISGAVDLGQFDSWIFQNTGIAAVPEPGSACICAIASLMALRRRR